MSASSLKIIFAGTPEFAALTFKNLLNTEYHICAAYTQPDRPAGRGRQLQASPVKLLAIEHNIPVYQPASLRDVQATEIMREHHADLMIVVAYGLILPQSILNIPRLGCINVHASLLPRWRGAAPIQRAILAGDQTSGVTIMQMDSGLDTGAMLKKITCPILATDTAQDLHDRLVNIGSETLLQVLAEFCHGTTQAIPQDNSLANYAAKIQKADALINWQHSAIEIDRQVRAFNPYPICFTQLGDKTVRVWSTQIIATHSSAAPGTIVAVQKEGIDVATTQNILRIKNLQLPGGRCLTAAEILNAHAGWFALGNKFN